MVNKYKEPQFYADVAGIVINTFGSQWHFGIRRGERGDAVEPVAVMYLSLHLAKAIMLILDKQVGQYEIDHGVLNLPNEFLASIGRDDLLQ